MIETLRLTSRIVEDQDEALRFYTEKLGLEKKADEPFGADFRWLTVGAEQDETVEITLENPDWAEDEQEADRRAAMIGQQQALAFTVDDCHETYDTLHKRGIEFTSEPEEHPYGIQAVARDLYGNEIVLVERTPEAEAGDD
jgi:catechol 2,3-dioxygenase-like lactoylglutathione lyase family enzyme